MKPVTVSLAILPLAAALASAPLDGAEPLRVYFTTATPPAAQGDFKAQAQKLKGEQEAAWATYDVAFKQLEKSNGKKYDKWPAEAKEQAAASYENYVGKGLDYLLFTIKPKELEDSIRDISNAVAGKGLAGVKENVVMAQSAADAHLVVEAIARYGASKLTVGPKYFFYKISAGGKLKPEALKAVPSDWPKPGWLSDEPCTQYHRYRDDQPFLVFRTVNDQRWRDVMNTASACINDMIKLHGAALTSAP